MTFMPPPCETFTKDISVYWMHIARDGTLFIQFKAKGTVLIPVLRYIHAIIAYTITGRLDSKTVVNAIDVGILSHLYRGILVDLTYIFARQAQDYDSSTLKKSLGLGPFITRVARYFGVDTSTVRHYSTSTIPLDHTIL